MNLREFNPDGIEAFKAFLLAARMNPEIQVAHELLDDPSLTQEIIPKTVIEPKRFNLRRDAANYLIDRLDAHPQDWVAQNAGLWTWLSLYYFDEVCRAENGRRQVNNDYYYVFEPRNPRHFYRHLLFIAWHTARVASPFDRLYLDNPLCVLDKVTTEVMKRLYLIRVPCIFEVLDRIYWDPKRNRSRVGIVSATAKAGDLVHRFPIRIRQLEKTYDLYSLQAEQLIELLGEEFVVQDMAKASSAS